MNRAKYAISPVFSKTQGVVGLSAFSKTMIFGIGHYHFPRHRKSVGVHTTNYLAKSFGFQWGSREESFVYAAEGERVVLAKPKSWLPQHVGPTLKAAMREFEVVSLEDVIVVHYDKEQPVGFFNERLGGRVEHIPELQAISDTMGSDRFRRLEVGVGAPTQNYGHKLLPTTGMFYTQEELDELFLLNRVPHEHEETLDLALKRIRSHVNEHYAKL